MTNLFRCAKCDAKIPNLNVSEDAWAAIERSLVKGSVTHAVAELKYYANCKDEAAKSYIDHVLTCAYAWPITKADEEVLKNIEKEFYGLEKPEHFTNYTHCDECYEHDQTLRNSSIQTAKREDFGNSGRDPITFSSGEGFAYYFSVLARYALIPDIWRNNGWYGEQILWHLSLHGEENKLITICNFNQKEAVLTFLRHMESTRQQALCNYMVEDKLKKALEVWSIT